MRLSAGSSLAAIEAKSRYELINDIVGEVETRAPPSVTTVASAWTASPITRSSAPSCSCWSWRRYSRRCSPGRRRSWTSSTRPPPCSATRCAPPCRPAPLTSLLVDGVIAGVGSVIVFLPQILILFAFIILLEDTGYMPRVAFLIDRLMRLCGLSGQSFIPMLSSFACAVPGIMATRVIPERRDRLATITGRAFHDLLRAPAGLCPADWRLHPQPSLPRQAPSTCRGWSCSGSTCSASSPGVFTALLMKRTALRGPTPTFLIELPPYRLPNCARCCCACWSADASS